ncbi:SCO family protein [Sedimenticola hydrogenitrophicus]|uniref:SCO family protein n=1 Tax=Sedimenticola hydrogenitrophicus TaxID=2967975 RepID=UPI0023AFC5A1|nr:SCO family protein [Sedimenticola hydrogenitrophicus]
MQPTNGNKPKRPWLIPLALILMAVGLSAGLLLRQAEQPMDRAAVPQLTSGTLIPDPRPLAPFRLTTHGGGEFSQESIKGAWHLFSFGYTRCPDVCPTTLALLARLADHLRQASPDMPIKTAFVTIDPERDTQKVLADYVTYFDPAFLGVTGERRELDKLTRQLGVLHARVDTENSAMGYLMDHSTAIILTNPQGEFQALFSAPHEVEAMARDLIRITTH